MTNAFNNIQNALNNGLNSVSGLSNIIWPSMDYLPVSGVDFIRPTLMPAKSVLFDLAHRSEHKGIYQVDLFTSVNSGTATILQRADSIRNYFTSTVSFTSGGDTIYIQAISINTPKRADSWFMVSVQIDYLCYN